MTLPHFLRRVAKDVARIPIAGNLIRGILGGRLHLRYHFKHPFDTQFGVETSGYISTSKLGADKALTPKINDYAAIQPTVVRRAIETLGPVDGYTFVDLGCGKGRAIIVASEYPFAKIAGVELSTGLVQTALINAAVIGEKYPARPKIEVIEGDAVNFPVLGRKLVLFLFNPFGEELIKQTVKNIEAHLAAGDIDHLFVIYHNCVWNDAFEASPALSRWYAAIPVNDAIEQPYGPDIECATVIWQSKKNALPPKHANASRAVVRVNNYRTALAD